MSSIATWYLVPLSEEAGLRAAAGDSLWLALRDHRSRTAGVSGHLYPATLEYLEEQGVPIDRAMSHPLAQVFDGTYWVFDAAHAAQCRTALEGVPLDGLAAYVAEFNEWPVEPALDSAVRRVIDHLREGLGAVGAGELLILHTT